MTNENDLFNRLGINVTDGKITIDTNQTKNFFNAIKSTFDSVAKNMEETIKQGKEDGSIDMENVGIKVDNDKIDIDLKKTRSFIEELGKKAESFLTEIDTSIKEISDKHNK